MVRILKYALFLALIAAAWMSVQVYAQDGQPNSISDDEVNAIARQLYCPVCENIPLDVCPTQACADWREEIRDLLAQGYSEREVKQYFVDRYGDRVLEAPPARGFNWLAYIVPPVAILIGAFLLFKAFQAWKQPLPGVSLETRAGESGAAPNAAQDEYIARLEEELRKR